MNVVILSGKLFKDVDFRMTESGFQIAKFSLRVQGTTKNKETGKYDAEFYDCVAFGKTAELLGNYVHAGDTLPLRGHLKKDKYTDKNGQQRTITNIVVETFDFPQRQSNGASNQSNFDGMGEQMNIDF